MSWILHVVMDMGGESVWWGLHRDYTGYFVYAVAHTWAALTALCAERSDIRDICRT